MGDQAGGEIFYEGNVSQELLIHFVKASFGGSGIGSYEQRLLDALLKHAFIASKDTALIINSDILFFHMHRAAFILL